MANVQLRHFDYLLSVGTIPAGQSIKQIPLVLDYDADFVLRSRVVHCQSLVAGLPGQSALANYFDRITGPDSGEYLSQSVVRFQNENQDYGQYGSPLPVRPPVIYPRGGTIMLDVQNTGNSDLSGVEVYFRGSKMYAPGVLPCYTYPENCSPFPFIYGGAVRIGQQAQLTNNQVLVKNESDFVCRSLTIGSMNLSNALAQYFQLYIQLRDQDNRPYSNLPVHVDACFGAFGSIVTAQQPTTRTGPYHPGLLTPEIYIPANNFLYYDMYRRDNYKNGPGGLSPVDARLAFNGMKVYHR